MYSENSGMHRVRGKFSLFTLISMQGMLRDFMKILKHHNFKYHLSGVGQRELTTLRKWDDSSKDLMGHKNVG